MKMSMKTEIVIMDVFAQYVASKHAMYPITHKDVNDERQG